MRGVLEVADGVSGYPQLVEHVLFHGQKREARGLPTVDAGWLTVMIHDTTRCLPLGVGRNVNRRIAAAEAVQLVGGFSSPDMLVRASRNFERFVEPDTGRFWGAYGERTVDQFAPQVVKLRADPETRQAVVTLWDPWRDNQRGKRDYPCTVAVGLEVNRGALELNVVMRSQDIWWGTPFDWFQWGQVQHTVARSLGVEVGPYRHTTWSTHIYTAMISETENLVTPPHRDEREWQPLGFGVDEPGHRPSIIMSQSRAREIGHGHHARLTGGPTPSEAWYVDQLAPLLSDREGPDPVPGTGA